MSVARLQQTVAILALALALLVAWLLIQSGNAWVAVPAAVAILSAHATFLALEFFLMGAVNRRDPAPRPSAAELLGAWWSEVVTAAVVFGWRQPFRSRMQPDHLPDTAHRRRGVVLVHGYMCNRGLWNRWLARLSHRAVPTIAVNLEPMFASIDDYVPVIERAVRTIEALTDQPPILVGHSMGGLAIRRWRAEPNNAARIHHVLTLGSPHGGTWLARFAMSANAREMQQGSRWTHSLREREPPITRFTCYFSHCDNIVFPAYTATLPGADNRHLRAVAHVAMVEQAEPFDLLLRLLDDAAPAQRVSR